MNKKIKKLLIFIIVFLVFFTIGTAFVHKGDILVYETPKANPIFIFDTTNVDQYHDCHIEGKTIIADNTDAYIEYLNIPKEAKSFEINFFNNEKKVSNAFIQWKLNDSYYSFPCSNEINIDEQDSYLYTNKFRDVNQIKIFINDDTSNINNICVYDKDLSTTLMTQHTSWYYYIGTLLISIFLTIIFIYLNKKYKWLEIIWKTTINNKKTIYRAFLTIISSLVISFIIEVVLAFFIFFENSLGWLFNPARYIFIFGLTISGYLIIKVFKNKEIKEETIFATSAITIGIVIILASPFGYTCWDLDSHFNWIKGMSNISPQATEAENQIIHWDPLAMNNIDTNLVQNQLFEDDFNYLDKIASCNTKRDIQVSHIPGSIIYSLSKFLGIPITVRIALIKFLYLILYTLITSLAIKKLKSHKMLLITISLFPTSLFLASNIDYDWWVNSLSFLGMAYFLSELQQPNKKITTKEICIMCGSFLLASLPKQIYIPLLLIPMFLRKNYFKHNFNVRFKYLLKVSIFITILAISLISRAYFEIGINIDSRGGTDVNPLGQITYILDNPLDFCSTLWTFFLNYVNPIFSWGYITNFAYLGFDTVFYAILFVLMIAVSILDNNKYSVQSANLIYKILSLIFFIGTTILIITSLYVSFTPVGLNMVNGCQPRYLIPLLFPTISLLFSIKKNININKKYYYPIVIATIIFVNYWDISTLILPHMT